MRCVRRAVALLLAVALGSLATACAVNRPPGGPEAAPGAVQANMTCSRHGLRFLAEAYFVLLAAHDPAPLPFSPDLRFTENGERLQPGEGIWRTAGTARYKRSALDTERCQTHTLAVVEENGADVIVGVRIVIADAGVTEIETYVTRQGDYFFFDPAALAASDGAGPAGVTLESPVPEEQRSTRDELTAIADLYYQSFGPGGVVAPVQNDCYRWENGVRTAAGDCGQGLGVGSPAMITHRRYPFVDVETGIVVGYVMFGGALDFHMFKVVDGQVRLIHALVTASGHDSTGWEDRE